MRTFGKANKLEHVLYDVRGPVVDEATRMEEQGILLRRCDNYRGLGSEWFRTAVRSREDNERMLAALREALTEYNSEKSAL
jgi:histidinol-phosphate/aromatic aminotransferase/cobyric acid decarboxylase-like protein